MTDGKTCLSRRATTWTTSRLCLLSCIIASRYYWRGIIAASFSTFPVFRSGIFQDAWVGRGLAIGDIDNDGRVDAVVTTNGGAAHILHNETVTSNHWITLRLVGHKSNRDGIGAVIKLVTSEGPQWVTVTTSGSYLSASDPRVHFGLGIDPFATIIEITWPSGTIQKLANVKGDQQVRIDEPADSTPTKTR